MRLTIILLLSAICAVQYLENKAIYEIASKNAYAQCYEVIRNNWVKEEINAR